jgi:outer membrane cobalamin receptor
MNENGFDNKKYNESIKKILEGFGSKSDSNYDEVKDAQDASDKAGNKHTHIRVRKGQTPPAGARYTQTWDSRLTQSSNSDPDKKSGDEYHELENPVPVSVNATTKVHNTKPTTAELEDRHNVKLSGK